MASSSDTRSTRVWLEDTHVTLRRPRLAQASNDRITFVSALDQRNKRGYNVLLFRPPAHTGQKAKAVTVYAGHWDELEHNVRTRKPYLGIERLDIHEFDRESLPSDNEPAPELSDEEPTAPRPQSENSSNNDEPTQRYTPASEQRPASPTASDTSYTYYRGRPRELLHPNEHHSSIATTSQEQQPTTTDMATQTITTTAATTTIQPSTPPAPAAATTQATTTPSQQIAEHLQTALWRTPGGSEGPGSAGDPTGPGGPEGPEGPGGPGGPTPVAAPPAAPPVAAPANCDDRLMGSLPQP
jgi:hypothetical protein